MMQGGRLFRAAGPEHSHFSEARRVETAESLPPLVSCYPQVFSRSLELLLNKHSPEGSEWRGECGVA